LSTELDALVIVQVFAINALVLSNLQISPISHVLLKIKFFGLHFVAVIIGLSSIT